MTDRYGAGAGASLTFSPNATGNGQSGLVKFRSTCTGGNAGAAALRAATKAARAYILLKPQQQQTNCSTRLTTGEERSSKNETARSLGRKTQNCRAVLGVKDATS